MVKDYVMEQLYRKLLYADYLKNSRLMQEMNHRFMKRVVPNVVYHPFFIQE